MNKIKDLSAGDIAEIKYLASQSNGRFSLIQNIYCIDLNTLKEVLLVPKKAS